MLQGETWGFDFMFLSREVPKYQMYKKVLEKQMSGSDIKGKKKEVLQISATSETSGTQAPETSITASAQQSIE